MRWTLTTIYTTLIFSTLGIVRNLTEPIRATGNLGTLTFLLVGIFLFFLAFFNSTKISKNQLKLRLILIISFITLTATVTNLPEERMHVIEYGLLGWLIGWSLSSSPMTFCRIFSGALLGWTIGLGDEIIQYFLPNRVYDIRDVILNGVSVTLGLIFFMTSELEPMLKTSDNSSVNDE